MSTKIKKNTELTDLNFALLMALPVIFFLVFVVIYPLAYAFWMSLHKVSMFGGLKFKFIGLEDQIAEGVCEFSHYVKCEVTKEKVCPRF